MLKIFASVILLLASYIGYQFVDHFDPDSLKGKNVVITGASTGIGEQLAYHYARLGANIVITARRENRLIEVIENCRNEGRKEGKYFYVVLDMSQEDSTKRLIEFAERNLVRTDILVLNHVVYHYGKWNGTPDDLTQFHRSMDINLYSYIRAATHAIPELTKSKGSIVVINSLAGKIPNPFLSTYSTAKHALEGFFGSLRDEFIMSDTDISITMCYLAFTNTENAVSMMNDLGANQIIQSASGYTASDAALAIIKGATQRWQRVYHPYLLSKFSVVAFALFPETLSSQVRDAFVPSEKN